MTDERDDAHTPTPWVWDERYDRNIYSNDATGSVIAKCGPFEMVCRGPDEERANARFIVQAVNGYATLRKACQQYRPYLEECVTDGAADVQEGTKFSHRAQAANYLLGVLATNESKVSNEYGPHYSLDGNSRLGALHSGEVVSFQLREELAASQRALGEKLEQLHSMTAERDRLLAGNAALRACAEALRKMRATFVHPNHEDGCDCAGCSCIAALAALAEAEARDDG